MATINRLISEKKNKLIWEASLKKQGKVKKWI